MKTPHKFNELDKTLDFDADSGRESSSQINLENIACINARRSISGLCAALAILTLSGAVPREADALPPADNSEDHSGVIDLASLKASLTPSEIAEMSWEEIEQKFERMNTSDILSLMGSVGEVVEDFKKTFRSGIHDKLLDKDLQAAQPESQILDEGEKQLLLEMAQKYGVKDIQLVTSILTKTNLSERDCKFLFVTFRKIISAQRKYLSTYIKTREWVLAQRGHDPDSRVARMRADRKALEYFMQMEMLMARVEEKLSRK